MTTTTQTLALPVVYTDALIGVTSWPLTSVAWSTTALVGKGGTEVVVVGGLQPAGLLPDLNQPGDALAAGAADITARFAAVWYQIQQPDVTATLRTTLQQPAGAALPDPLPLDMSVLRTYVTEAYRFARDASLLAPALADPAVTATLNAVVAHYGLSWQALGFAAGLRLLAHLVVIDDAGFTVPRYTTYTAGSSPAQMMAPGTHVGDMLADPDNLVLPLKVGTELHIPATTVTVAHGAWSAAALAEHHGLSLASLVAVNADTPSLLRPGFVFYAEGVAVEIPPLNEGDPATAASLNQVAATFAQEGVPFDAVMVVGANADQPGMFRAGAELVLNRRLVEAGWTLQSNDTGVAPSVLAQANTRTSDLFPAGSPLLTALLQLQGEDAAKAGAAPLGALARAYAVTPGDLLRHNSDLAPVKPDDGDRERAVAALGLPIAGLAAFPAAWQNKPPAKLPPGTGGITPAALADLLKRDPTLVLAANQATPDLVLPSLTLKAAQNEAAPVVITAAADSLNAVIGRFADEGVTVTIADLAQANATVPFLANGAVVLLPPADFHFACPIGRQGWRFPGTFFPLRTTLTLTRNPVLVAVGAEQSEVAIVTNQLPAQRFSDPVGAEHNAETLAGFANMVAQAIPGLQVAAGGCGDPGNADLFALSFVAGVGISQVSVTPPAPTLAGFGKQPYSFALRPLYSQVQSADAVAVAPLNPATGQLEAAKSGNYQGVNVEDWAVIWLSGLDLMATAPYATAAYLTNAVALGRLLAAKQQLVEAVANGLGVVLADQAAAAGVGSAAWNAARAVFRQRLRGGLKAAFEGGGVLQYQTAVTAPADAGTCCFVGAGVLSLDDDAARLARLGNAVLSLQNTAAGTLNFPFSMSRQSELTQVSLVPSYAVNQLETNITPVIAGFTESDRYQFVRDFNAHPPSAFQVDLGTPVVPLPNRAYPNQCALSGQNATLHPDAGNLAAALLWDYHFTVATKGAARDQLLVTVDFNRPPAARATKREPDALFAALAQYAAIETPLWALLDHLQQPDRKPDDNAVSAALETFADLAEQVSAAWSDHWATPPTAGLTEKSAPFADRGLLHSDRQARPTATQGLAPHSVHAYLVDWLTGPDGRFLTGLMLTPNFHDEPLPWPDLAIGLVTGAVVTLEGGDPLRGTRTYLLPEKIAVPVFEEVDLMFTFAQLPVAAYQSAAAAVSAQRNTRLLGQNGSLTSPAFVMRTPESVFPEPVVPLIVVNGPQEMGVWREDGAAQQIEFLLAVLFGDGEPTGELAWSIRYGYTMAQGDPPLVTLLPVALHPRAPVTATTATDLVQVTKDWRAKVNPVTTDAFWAFSLTLYSTVNPAQTRSLLELQQLIFRLEP